MEFVSADKHGDGKVSLGTAAGEGSCNGCHGTAATSGAPPADLSGSSDTTRVGVGLHQAHQGSGNFAGGVSCSDCHAVPASLKASGHIDTDLPAEVTFSDLARGKAYSSSLDLKPTWDRSSATCKNVYCHSLVGAEVTQWVWTKPASPALGCGSCHSLPPTKTLTGGTHPTSSALCSSCHKGAYTGTGNLDPDKHINGKVDF
jgi:predicted CxxxxCH...CXXCH cytochrome family protein